MAEGRSITLPPDAGWRLLGSTPEKSPVEVVLRAFDVPVLFATGRGPAAPDAAPTAVAPGEGARLSGLHFFAKPATPGAGGRILVRGV